MVTPEATLRVGKVSPAAVESGLPLGKIYRKSVAITEATENAVEVSLAALRVEAPPFDCLEELATPVAALGAGKASPAAVELDRHLRRSIDHGDVKAAPSAKKNVASQGEQVLSRPRRCWRSALGNSGHQEDTGGSWRGHSSALGNSGHQEDTGGSWRGHSSALGNSGHQEDTGGSWRGHSSALGNSGRQGAQMDPGITAALLRWLRSENKATCRLHRKFPN